MRRILLLVAHGTVENIDDLPEFLREIRHGRPAPPSLLAELEDRYTRVGGSPLLEHTQAQARALQRKTGIETRIAMRLWQPRVSEVTADLGAGDKILLVPVAPFSVGVYESAARKEVEKMEKAPELLCIKSWGEQPALIEAYAGAVMRGLSCLPEGQAHIILSAHSLPQIAIDRGDPYDRQFLATAQLTKAAIIAQAVEKGIIPPKVHTCYQSQGAQKGEWLGPSLSSVFRLARAQGAINLVVSPIGFLTEHIETLFDLDIEARELARSLGLGFHRVPALGDDPGLVEALTQAIAGVSEWA